MTTTARPRYISDAYVGMWTIMTWDADRDVWLEGPTYRTRAEARAVLREWRRREVIA